MLWETGQNGRFWKKCLRIHLVFSCSNNFYYTVNYQLRGHISAWGVGSRKIPNTFYSTFLMGKDSFFSKPFALPSHNLNKFIRKLFSSSIKRMLKTSLLQSCLDLNLHLTFHATPNSNRCRLGGLAIRYYVKWYLILGHAIWLSLYSPRSCMKGEYAVSLQRSITSWSHEKTPASSRCSQCILGPQSISRLYRALLHSS